MGTPESSHPPSLSHTSKYTTHTPMVTLQVTSQAQGETPLAKVQPAPQCSGRPFRERGLAGRPRAPCAARETAPGAAARYAPPPKGARSHPGLGLQGWQPLYGVLPLRLPSQTPPPALLSAFRNAGLPLPSATPPAGGHCSPGTRIPSGDQAAQTTLPQPLPGQAERGTFPHPSPSGSLHCGSLCSEERGRTAPLPLQPICKELWDETEGNRPRL